MIIGVTSGFELGSKYKSQKKLSVTFAESFEISDVEGLVKEIFEEDTLNVEYTDEFKDGVIITLTTSSEEQVENFKNKLREKYSSFSKMEEANEGVEIVDVIDMPSIEARDLVKSYIKPVVITFVITLIFLAIIFRKLGIVKSLVIPAIVIIGINALYISIVSILRIPVNEYVISGWMLVYAMSLIGTAWYTKTIS